MKRTAFLLLFLFACLSLFAQSYRQAKVYVPVIAGGLQEEKEFFHDQLSYEVVLHYHQTVKQKRGSEFTLKGTVEPYTGAVSPSAVVVELPPQTDNPVPPRANPRVRNTNDRREFFSWEVDRSLYFYDTTGDDNYIPSFAQSAESDGDSFSRLNPDGLEFVFYLEFIKNSTNEVVGEQYIIYKDIDASISQLVSIMVYNMLSMIPAEREKGDFRDKWLFVEAGGLWTPRLYIYEAQSMYWFNFGFGFKTEFHFLDYMAIGLGAQVSQDWVILGEEQVKDVILDIPLTLKLVFKPAEVFMLEPYTGFSANVSLSKTTKPSPFSWLIGFQMGVGLGPGVVFIDPRFALDFYPSAISNSPQEYRRYLMQVGIGYKIGFFQKNGR